MQKQKLILIIGIILGVIAVILIKIYLEQQRSYIADLEKKKGQKIQENLIPVLVAKKEIPKGSPVEDDAFEVQNTPKEFAQPQAVTSLSRISGMMTAAPIAKGEQITLSKLVWPAKASSGSGGSGTLAMITPVGKRAVTISVDNIASLAGMIKAGDYVDVIALVPVPGQTVDKKQTIQAAVMPLFQNVLVLAVGHEIGRPSMPSSSLPEVGRYSKVADEKGVKTETGNMPQLITLALGPQESNLITFVQEQGRIRLTLRSPADSQVQPSVPTTWDTLFQYVMPNKETADGAGKEEKNKAPKEVVEYVEIYRGLNREKIPLSK